MGKASKPMEAPQDKARRLIEKFMDLVPVFYGGMSKDLATQCAIITVDELIKEYTLQYENPRQRREFWEATAKELEVIAKKRRKV